MKRATVRVVLVRAGEEPKVCQLATGLESWQGVVGGLIQAVPVGGFFPRTADLKWVDLICNDEGKLDGLPYTLNLGHDVIAGNCFFTGSPDDEGEPSDLTDAQLAAVQLLLSVPGVVLR